MLFPGEGEKTSFADFYDLPGKSKLANSTAILVISPLSKAHHGSSLEAIIRKIEEKGFKRVLVVITDRIKEYMLRMDASNQGKSNEALTEEAIAIGDKWLNSPENVRAMAFLKETPKYQLIRWSEVNHQAIIPVTGKETDTHELLTDAYDQSEPNTFSAAVNLQAKEVLSRFIKQGRINIPDIEAEALEAKYLLSEYAGLMALSLQHNAEYIIYPDKKSPPILNHIQAVFLGNRFRQLMRWAGYGLKEKVTTPEKNPKRTQNIKETLQPGSDEDQPEEHSARRLSSGSSSSAPETECVGYKALVLSAANNALKMHVKKNGAIDPQFMVALAEMVKEASDSDSDGEASSSPGNSPPAQAPIHKPGPKKQRQYH